MGAVEQYFQVVFFSRLTTCKLNPDMKLFKKYQLGSRSFHIVFQNNI